MIAPLYARILGDDWLKLAEAIRCAHAVDTDTGGVFKITRGSGRLAKTLARLSNLPRAAEAADTRLNITSEDNGERWERRFDGKLMTTTQWEGTRGVLVERFHGWELLFTLQVKDGDLFYHQSGARLRLGPLRVPMPRILSPYVFAKEIQSGSERIRVSVTVTLPIAGLLIAYDGHLDTKENIS